MENKIVKVKHGEHEKILNIYNSVLDVLKNNPDDFFDFIIKKHKENRTLQQNATMWMWEADIAKQVGYNYTSKEEKEFFHKQLLMSIYGAKKVKVKNLFKGNEVYTLEPKKRTRDFNVEQMADHLKLLEMKAAEMGWYIRHPDIHGLEE